MTPKTQYQKMRDNRARREAWKLNVEDCITVNLPKDPEPGFSVRVASPAVIVPGSSDWSSVTLEDGSILSAFDPLQNDPHHELRKTWAPGQRWQGRPVFYNQWNTYDVGIEPAWLRDWVYRRHPSDIDQEKPWYPDSSGEWVEVPDDCMECPVPKHVVVEVLKAYEREDKEYAKEKRPAKEWNWDFPADTDERNVAYKVVA